MQQNDGLLAGIMVQSECHTDLLLPFALVPMGQDTPSVLSGKDLGSHSLGDHSSSVTRKHTQVANHIICPKASILCFEPQFNAAWSQNLTQQFSTAYSIQIHSTILLYLSIFNERFTVDSSCSADSAFTPVKLLFT